MLAGKGLMSLCPCEDMPEPLLLVDAIIKYQSLVYWPIFSFHSLNMLTQLPCETD